jgi:hypothetical protein
MRLFTFASVAALSVVHPLLADPVVDIPKIAGKEPAAAEKILGKPTDGEKTKHGKTLIYKKGKVEIVYINGKADWITVNDLNGVPFDESATKALGLDLAKPTFKGPMAIRWEPAGKLASVAVFELEGKVGYAYIKVATK